MSAGRNFGADVAKNAQISAKIAEARATSAISFCVLYSVLSVIDKTESTGLRTPA